mmetsp:Transcript_8768/g.24705  ORF Transcript_8768/g.24705 Transcript_8768/m.24705 type:complete len:87 (+) Transcript_8768:3-263(+)
MRARMPIKKRPREPPPAPSSASEMRAAAEKRRRGHSEKGASAFRARPPTECAPERAQMREAPEGKGPQQQAKTCAGCCLDLDDRMP